MIYLIRILLGVFIMFFASGAGIAGEQAMGEKEYLNSCAICHGVAGDGLGPYLEMLSMKPSDLTVLASENGGVFPVDQVHKTIDGRYAKVFHGPRTMPIWGFRYRAMLEDDSVEHYVGHNPEIFVKERILSLIGYLETIQKR